MMAKPRRKEKAVADNAGWEQNRKPKRPLRDRLNGCQWHGADRRRALHRFWRQMARGIRSADRSKSCPPRRSISKAKVQPAELPPTRAAPARVPAGRMSASKMSACGVATPTAVLRLYRYEQTHYGQKNENYARRPHKEGNSIGHALPIPRKFILSLLLFACPGVRSGTQRSNPTVMAR
jgi:hypothetical protein